MWTLLRELRKENNSGQNPGDVQKQNEVQTVTITWQYMVSESRDTRTSTCKWLWKYLHEQRYFRGSASRRVTQLLPFGSILLAGNPYGHIFLILYSVSKPLFFEGGFAYWQMPFAIWNLVWSWTMTCFKQNHHLFPIVYKLTRKTVPKEKISKMFWAIAALPAWPFGFPKTWLRCNILLVHIQRYWPEGQENGLEFC